MRQTIKYEFWVGLFLLLGIGSLIFLGLKVANVQPNRIACMRLLIISVVLKSALRLK